MGRWDGEVEGGLSKGKKGSYSPSSSEVSTQEDFRSLASDDLSRVSNLVMHQRKPNHATSQPSGFSSNGKRGHEAMWWEILSICLG